MRSSTVINSSRTNAYSLETTSSSIDMTSYRKIESHVPIKIRRASPTRRNRPRRTFTSDTQLAGTAIVGHSFRTLNTLWSDACNLHLSTRLHDTHQKSQSSTKLRPTELAFREGSFIPLVFRYFLFDHQDVQRHVGFLVFLFFPVRLWLCYDHVADHLVCLT